MQSRIKTPTTLPFANAKWCTSKLSKLTMEKPMRRLIQVVALCFFGVSMSTMAQEAAEQQDGKKRVTDKIETILQMGVKKVTDSPLPGMYQVVTERGLFYVSHDAKYFVQGRVFNLDEGMRNETEEALSGLRLDGMKAFQNDMIEFKAENEKYAVAVFTDITCGYCRKLHNEMAEYNKRGITVRYLAFPRGGPNSQSFSDMESVWCAKDKQEAMNLAKAGDSIAKTECANKVRDQYLFGQQIGVTGTPAMILADGSIVPGYQPAGQLEQALQQAL